MAEPTAVSAAALLVGNEILSGRTRDANLQFLGAALGELGIRLAEARVVGDDVAAIIGAVNALRDDHAYVFTTGGIGPTHDDVTAEAVAKAFGVRLVRNPEAVRRLGRMYAAEDLNPARLRMANIPEGAELIDNPISQAPGFRMGNVFVLAGVPRIMQAMFDGIRHRLKGGARMLARTITIYLPEGMVAGGLARVQAGHPEVEIGSYPFQRGERVGVAVVIRSPEEAANERAATAVRMLAESLGARPEEH